MSLPRPCKEPPPKVYTQCSHDPRKLAGCPIGMYHCPECGEMVIAGLLHPAPDDFDVDKL